jgi:hypothetical protein
MAFVADTVPNADYGARQMLSLRALIRDHCHLAMALLALALCIKALVPAGFMVSASSTIITVTVCSDASGGMKTMQIALPMKPGHAKSDPAQDAKASTCAFAGLAHLATTGTPPLLLAIALAAILLLGVLPQGRLPLKRAARLRPPLRGPPATA